MKTEWKQIKLGDYADFSNGINFGKDYYSNGIKLITVSDFKDRLNPNYDTLVEVNDSVVRESDLLRNNDIVFVRSNGNKELVGRCMIIKDLQTKLTYSGFCIRARFNNIENVSPNYFVYYFKSPLFRKSIANSSVGANIQNLNQEILSSHKVLLPPLHIQQKIANILSRYDETIENNNKRIKLLEQMAQNLYKEWFVRFRFPGWQNAEFEKSSIGKIPTSFKVIKQNEVISDYIGGGWGEDEESSNFPIQAAVVRGADFPEFIKGDISTCPIRFHKKSNYDSRIIGEDDIVLEVSGGTQEQPVGRTVIVTKERLDRFEGKLICASFCKLIRLNKKIIAPFFYYYWMQFVYDTRMIDRYQLQSTGIINFKFEYFLRKGDVLLPPSELMWEFDSKVRKIHKQIENLAIANENLTKQRDLLLPRLMSAKLEVE